MDYPLIASGVNTIKTNEYTQRPIRLGDSVYQTFAAPVIPWFAKPYEFVSPYVSKADSFGDKTLEKLDERFPVVKKPTEELYNDTKVLIMLPYRKGIEGKDHVFQIYSSEFKKNDQQPGLRAYGKAAVTTALVVSSETLSWVSSFLSAKKQQAAEITNEKINQ